MPDLLFGTTPIDPDIANPEPAPDSAFVRGLRSGVVEGEGTTRAALAVNAQPYAGLRDFAANQYARSNALSKEAEAIRGPDWVGSYKDVLKEPTISGKLSKGWDYITGLTGSSLPAAALATGAGLLTRSPAKALAAATAVYTPMEIGEVAQRQQTDPSSMAMTPEQRRTRANTSGLASAAMQSIVPAAIEAKVAGRLGHVPSSLAYPMEAATEAGGEAFKQLGVDRNAPWDTNQLMESAVGGAAGAVGFHAAGKAADAAHGTVDKTAEGVSSLFNQVRTGATNAADAVADTTSKVSGKAKDAYDDIADRIAKDLPVGKKAPTNEAELAANDEEAKGYVSKFAEDLMADRNVPDEVKARVAQAAQGLDDIANRSMIAKEYVAKRMGEKIDALGESLKEGGKLRTWLKDKAEGGPYSNEAYDLFEAEQKVRDKKMRAEDWMTMFDAASPEAREQYKKAPYDDSGLWKAPKRPTDTKKSEDYSGINQVIMGTIAPAVQQHSPEVFERPDLMAKFSDAVRSVVIGLREGKKLDSKAAETMQSMMGEDYYKAIAQIHNDVLGKATPAQDEALYGTLLKSQKRSTAQRELQDKVMSSLTPDLQESMTTSEAKQLVKDLREHVRSLDADPTTLSTKMKFDQLQRENAMRQAFGDKYEAVLDEFRKKQETMSGRTLTDDKPLSDVIDSTDEFEATQAQAEESLRSDEKADNFGNDPQEIEYETPKRYNNVPISRADAERAQYDRPSLLDRARAENPDRNVAFVTERDAAIYEGREPKEGDDKVGYIEVSGMKQDGRLTRDQAAAMRLDTKSYSNSPSRIDTDQNGVTLDAQRITQQTLKTMKYSASDEKGSMHRIARAFYEGLGSAQLEFNASVGELPDNLVIFTTKGGQPVLLKDVKDLGFGPSAPKTVEELTLSLTKIRDGASKLQKKLQYVKDVATKNSIKEKLEGMGKSAARIERQIEDIEYRKSPEGVESREKEKEQFNRYKEYEAQLREIAPEDQIHLAVAEHGEKDVQRLTGLDGNALRKDLPPPNPKLIKKDGRLTLAGKLQISVLLQDPRFSKFAPLLDVLSKMAPEDQTRLYGLLTANDRQTPGVNEKRNREAQELDANLADFEYRDSAGEDVRRDELKALRARRKLLNSIDPYDSVQKSAASDYTLDVLEQLNEKYTNTKRSEQELGGKDATPNELKSIKDYIDTVLGDSVKLAIADIPHAGEFTRRLKDGSLKPEDFIRISAKALDKRSVAYHEALHAFFAKLRDIKADEVMKPLYAATETEHVQNQLKEIFKDNPSVLKQINSSAEERVAYVYQLWENEKITLAPTAKGLMTRIKEVIMKVLGIWTNDQRAEHIMDYFATGGFKADMNNRNAVLEATMKPGTNAAVEWGKEKLAPVTKINDAVISAGSERMRESGIPAFKTLADKIQRKRFGEASDPGFIPAAGRERTTRLNNLIRSFGNVDADTMREAQRALAEAKPATSPGAQHIVAQVKNFLQETRNYMLKAGVDVGNLGPDYYPRVWDTNLISKNQDAFMTMLQKYQATGQLKGDPNKIMQSLMAHDGLAKEEFIVVDQPGMQHLKERKLDFISPEDAANFVDRDLMRTMNSYVTQAARRAEWARRFGDDGSQYRALLEEAKEQGATKEQIDTAQDFIRSVDGTLGDDINPSTRRLFGNILVYQNLRLLPLSLFSSIVDPMGIMVRGGTMGDAFGALKRGLSELPRPFKKDPKNDQWHDLAEDLGIIDNTTLLHTIGSSYTQGMVGEFGRKANDMLFKLNGMEQFNTSMRVAATEAAVRFIARHADGKYSEHSARWMKELNLEPRHVIMKDGRPLISAAEFEAHGMSPEEAVDASARMKAAVADWVDGAILRPNSADKPIWMSDPRWALIAHMKQFVYAFQHTIIDRVYNEAEHGNYKPGMALAGYVPIMIAADLAKGMIQGGGEQPEWKKGWTAMDYMHSGIERAGLYGTGQFYTDLGRDITRGSAGSFGPAAGQALDALKVMGGSREPGSFALDALPANAVYKHLAKGSGGDLAPLRP